METFYCAAVFVFGLVIGSFLNVCIFRLPTGESVAAGRSHCMSCGATIRWYDLIPVLSYMFLGGRCRGCGERISIRYPMVELLHALLWCAAYLRFGFSPRGLIVAALISVLLVAAGIDYDTQLIYERFNIIIALLGLLSFFFAGTPSPLSMLLGALCISLPMLALALLSGGFGGGDIKLAAACGLVLGWQQMLLAAALAAVAGGSVAATMLLFRRAERRSVIAFGPFLAFGVIAAALYGEGIIGWYLSLF